MNTPARFLTAVFVSVLILPTVVCADVKLSAAISDHMVLQRDFAAPIWGTAAPGEAVSVSIAGQTKTIKADDKGNWRVKLDPLKVAEGLTLIVKGNNTVTIQDVLVGEVWVGSGQSNMDGRLRSYAKNDPGLEKLLAAAPYPRIRLFDKGGKGWQLATPENVGTHGALLFPFGARLQEELNVPVGLMLAAVGGTPSGYWLSDEMLRADAACQAQAAEFGKTYDYDKAKQKYDEDLAKWKEAVETAKKENQKLPAAPRAPGRAGEAIGGKTGMLYDAHIKLFAGYGIRGVLWDQGESGTAIAGVDQFNVMGALIKGWRKAWDQDFPFLYVQKPSGGGPAWDTSDPITKNASAFTALPAKAPGPNDGIYRELHIRIQQHPNTAMVTCSDLGSGIHPANKSGYGARAARVALGTVYGKKVEMFGPAYASHAVEGNKVRVKFTHTGQGLAARPGEKLQGFVIAGEDKVFRWADAVIDGDTVLVLSAEVAKPAAVRYAWAQNFPWANLFNKDGLPAQTFRTDNWK